LGYYFRSDAKSGKSGHNAESRKKKKSYYANLKKQEDDKLAELAAKYRDRAKERRDGGTNDPRAGGASEEPGNVVGGPGASGAYRAVAPDIKSTFDAAERRKKMIQESKFLGGDMEHTHLVKGVPRDRFLHIACLQSGFFSLGLDFALLQKVRSEISNREKEGEYAEDDEEEEEAPSKEGKSKQ
jgi:IK cytokine